MTITLEPGMIWPEGFDPNDYADGERRHALARFAVAEVKNKLNAAERFVQIMAMIWKHKLYKLLPTPYQSFDGFVLGEFSASSATAKRWITQGNALLALGAGEPSLPAIGPGEDGSRVSHSENALGIERPNQPARISQRQAAKAKAERRKAAEPPQPNPAPTSPKVEKPKPPIDAPMVADPVVLDPPMETMDSAPSPVVEKPEPPVDTWEEPEPPAPVKSTAAVVAREHLDTLLNLIAILDVERIVGVATPQERRKITKFAAAFIDRQPVGTTNGYVKPNDCKHPRNRRLGTACALCGTDPVKL